MAQLSRVAANWRDYELIDSGDFEKLERFGPVLMVRPEPQALWAKERPGALWTDVNATYSRTGREGDWQIKKKTDSSWVISWKELKFKIGMTSFKHTGLFPEQASNWEWLLANIKPGMKVLNLFGYTGGATIVASFAGAGEVVHVDSSRPMIAWGKENQKLSGLETRKIRWIEDDVSKFIAREIRRGNKYDIILMDPPAFGRGPEGEIWKFEEHLPRLVADCAKLVNRETGHLLVNAYSLGYPALAVENMVRSNVPFVKNIESVELTLKESGERGFELPTGVVIRASW
ncbi:MAG: class I SAM-dependent methyltransferase [bacterium]